MTPVVVERHIDLRSARAQLWCAVGDTERLNRAIGLGRLELSPNTDASAARFVVRTFLKIGVYAGPCYVVTANGVLDYFGQTVNIAARLQGASGPGEVVLDGQFADEAERAGWLSNFSISEHFEARLKGLPNPVRVARIVADGFP